MIKKIWFIINKKEKNLVYFFFFFGLINIVLEVFGISALIPILAIFSSQDDLKIGNYNFAYEQYSQIPLEYYLSIFLILFVTRVIFELYLNYSKINFSYNLNNRLTNQIFINFFKKKIINFSKINSAEIKRNLTNEIIFFSNTPITFVNILVDFAIVLSISFFLFYTYFNITVYIALTALVFGFLYLFLFQKKISKYSIDKSSGDFERIKYLSHIIDNFLDIRLKNKVDYFKKLFFSNHQIYLNSIKKINIIRSFPKAYFEIIFSILLVIFIIISLKYNLISKSNLLVQIGILIFSFSRILPLISKIIVNFQTLKFSEKSIQIIYQNINEVEKSYFELEDEKKIEFKNYIEVKNLFFKYTQQNLIENLNFKILKGSFNILKGKSGSGKSTLANILLGEIKPSKGEILVDGISIHKGINSWRKKISYISQSINLIDDSFLNNIAYGLPEDLIDKERVKNCAKTSQIHDFIMKQKNQYQDRVGEFGKLISQGQAQRIAIARALYFKSQFLILDEPTSSLDTENANLFLMDLKKIKYMTILLITHDESLLEYADNLINI